MWRCASRRLLFSFRSSERPSPSSVASLRDSEQQVTFLADRAQRLFSAESSPVEKKSVVNPLQELPKVEAVVNNERDPEFGIATGLEIQELLAEKQGKRLFDLDAPKGPFGTKVTVVAPKQDDTGSSSWKGSSNAKYYLGAGVVGLFGLVGMAYADEAEHGLPAPSYPWPHNGFLSSYDHAAIRRGHQVYQQVCAACHSLELVAFRDLIGVAYTEDEVKAMTAEIEVEDGPNDEGEMYTRPGKPSDYFPSPYANEAAARYANGGAYPPDLSLITKARHNGQNYVFSLLTGYRDPPAGVSVREGLHYNPYFPGGAIAMPKMLMDGAVEYEDSVPATETQLAKDVVTFLSWAAEPEMEERKLMGFKVIFVLSLALLQAGYYKRWKWAPIKSRRVIVDVVN